MTFPYKIKVDKCVGSCNDVKILYFKVCLPGTVKFLTCYQNKNLLKNISSHKSCKCGCLLDKKVCNNKQRWNKEKCRSKCFKKKKCGDSSFLMLSTAVMN